MRSVLKWFSKQQDACRADCEIAGLINDLVTANQTLFHHGILDSFGHVSVRHPKSENLFLMSRAVAPCSVQPADILVFDLDATAHKETTHSLYVERFIHSEIYKVRKDVNAVVHSHSPTVIPFSITQTKLRPVFHRASFLHPVVPVFEIRDVASAKNNMLVNDAKRGKALAHALGANNVVLMRGHGNVVVGSRLRLAISRAIETELNAKMQLQAMVIGGLINYLSTEEAETLEDDLARAKSSDVRGADRVWESLKCLIQSRARHP